MTSYHEKTIVHGRAIVPYSLENAAWALPGGTFTQFRHVAELWAVEMDKIMREGKFS